MTWNNQFGACKNTIEAVNFKMSTDERENRLERKARLEKKVKETAIYSNLDGNHRWKQKNTLSRSTCK